MQRSLMFCPQSTVVPTQDRPFNSGTFAGRGPLTVNGLHPRIFFILRDPYLAYNRVSN